MAKQAEAHPPPASDIPDKLYFRIGEVASLCQVETYVLRFWQTEFRQLKPVKSGTGQRLYRRRDVETALRIKRLLHEEGYTIAGARQVFAAEANQHRRSSAPAQSEPESSAADPSPGSASEAAADSLLGPGSHSPTHTAHRFEARSQPELPLLASLNGAEAAYAVDRAQALLARLRLELAEVHGMLSGPPSTRASQSSAGQGNPGVEQAHDEASLFEHGPR
jgi:DNA-binding transcriptional MerR regulator